MELRSLRAFVEVVRQGGFSRAAKVVSATQSAVSKAVAQLEGELGLQLLERIGHRSTLTAAGEIVYRRGLALLAGRDDLLAELEELRGLTRGILRLGLPPVGSHTLFAPLFAVYRRRYPGVEIQLVEHGSKRLQEMVLAGELDLAASPLPVGEDFEVKDVRCEPVDLLVAADDPLAKRSGVKLEAVKELPFILFEVGFALNTIILDACRQSGFTPTVTARSGQIDFILELVAAKVGVGFLPRMIVEERPHRGVCNIAIASPLIEWHMVMIWRREGYLSHASKAWLDLVGERGAGVALQGRETVGD
ncbi:MAG TPA: LysR substrate-binding domain-containing protein [Phycisphaerae bacterium]|nr:LysR substrate-binding domain-containing protein [Phycisphaerae bacterium]